MDSRGVNRGNSPVGQSISSDKILPEQRKTDDVDNIVDVGTKTITESSLSKEVEKILLRQTSFRVKVMRFFGMKLELNTYESDLLKKSRDLNDKIKVLKKSVKQFHNDLGKLQLTDQNPQPRISAIKQQINEAVNNLKENKDELEVIYTKIKGTIVMDEIKQNRKEFINKRDLKTLALNIDQQYKIVNVLNGNQQAVPDLINIIRNEIQLLEQKRPLSFSSLLGWPDEDITRKHRIRILTEAYAALNLIYNKCDKDTKSEIYALMNEIIRYIPLELRQKQLQEPS